MSSGNLVGESARDVRTIIKSGTIKAAIFDVYGTLIDWVPTIRTFLQDYARLHFPACVQELFLKDPSDSGSGIDGNLLLSAYDRIRREVQIQHPAALYPDILRYSLKRFCTNFGVDLAHGEDDKFASGPRTWPAFEDSRALLNRLKEKGLFITAVSNIDNKSLRYTCKHKLRFRFDHVVTAQQIRAYKPNRLLLDALIRVLKERNFEPREVVLIAQSLYADHKTAQTFYPDILRVHVNRPNSVLGLKLEGAPSVDMEVASLRAFQRLVLT